MIPNLDVKWSKELAAQNHINYVGRAGGFPCWGIEAWVYADKRVTLSPLNVDHCQIDIPVSELDAVINMLQLVKAKLVTENLEKLG